jgi:4-diphosphocytidyl-2-C-methyl-D-erythritol kinase
VERVRIRSYAKINLTLRVLGRRPDGYHDLRTVFQTVALHDTLTLAPRRGPFVLTCATPSVPLDDSNLIAKAAAALWRAIGRAGAPHGVAIALTKRIPLQAGLGGGSSNAAATLRALASIWRARLSDADLLAIAASLGADVPFFLRGGTALGVDRGDRTYRLPDFPPASVAIVLPDFGVSTADAYRWFAETRGATDAGGDLIEAGKAHRMTRPARRLRATAATLPAGWPYPAEETTNDLERPVINRYPEIGAIKRRLLREGAVYAAMSGSGSAVFGLFSSQAAADRATRRRPREGWRTFVTRTKAGWRISS